MVQTKTLNNSGGFGRVFLLALAVLVLFGAAFIVIERPFTNTGPQLETFYQNPFLMSVNAEGGVEVTLPTDAGMPNIPDCKDLDPTFCEWEAKLRSTFEDGEETIVIETDMTVNGEVIGKGMLMRVRTSAYEQLAPLAAKGIEYGWVSHILVKEGMRNQGLGRTIWQATDVMLRSVVGSGQGVHVFVDQAGWGTAIMSNVAQSDIVYAVDDMWAYIVR